MDGFNLLQVWLSPRLVDTCMLQPAFSSNNHTFISLFYQVNRAASRETCSKKYDSLVNNPPKVGYTQETLYSRAVVLKSVTEAVMDMTATPSYKQQPGHMSVNLMYSNLPGALALLQEAGETQTVLDWGCAWLRDSVSDSKTRDVALSMALTHCNAAAMLLEEDPDNALLAVEAMTAALKLLRDHGPHPQLEVDISGAMKVPEDLSVTC